MRKSIGKKKKARTSKQSAHNKDEPDIHNKGVNTKFTLDTIELMTDNQALLYDSIFISPLTLAVGPAGTGKSFIPVHVALKMLLNKDIEKIYLTRSPEPTGRSLGAFAGNRDEKMANWMGPIISQFESMIPKYVLKNLITSNKIEMIPFEVLKGTSFKNAFIIIEESQELDSEGIKMITTRIGDNCRMVMNGDIVQSNRRVHGKAYSNLVEALREQNEITNNHIDEVCYCDLLEHEKIIVPIVEFTKSDIVRSGITRLMVGLFEDFDV